VAVGKEALKNLKERAIEMDSTTIPAGNLTIGECAISN
jgi:hypothetical protein